MILLDTHIWIGWGQGDPRLKAAHRQAIQQQTAKGLGVSVISCWEFAKLVEMGRLAPPVPVSQWIQTALAYPGIQLIDFTPRIAVEATQLPGTFHKDPADRILVATARVLNCPMMTVDAKIVACSHVQTI